MFEISYLHGLCDDCVVAKNLLVNFLEKIDLFLLHVKTSKGTFWPTFGANKIINTIMTLLVQHIFSKKN